MKAKSRVICEDLSYGVVGAAREAHSTVDGIFVLIRGVNHTVHTVVRSGAIV